MLRPLLRHTIYGCPVSLYSIHRQSFHFDTEDTGPAYTQVHIFTATLRTAGCPWGHVLATTRTTRTTKRR